VPLSRRIRRSLKYLSAAKRYATRHGAPIVFRAKHRAITTLAEIVAVFTRIFVQSLIGVIQATETIKLLIGQGEPLVGRLLMYDALAMRFREIRIRRDPACPLCGVHPTITALQDYEAFCGLDAAALPTSGASRLAPSTACAGVETQRRPSAGRPQASRPCRDPQTHRTTARSRGSACRTAGALGISCAPRPSAREFLSR
jgi:bacteriocin biosynthesis cyclodehydratase domain-containing protein